MKPVIAHSGGSSGLYLYNMSFNPVSVSSFPYSYNSATLVGGARGGKKKRRSRGWMRRKRKGGTKEKMERKGKDLGKEERQGKR